MEQIICLLKSLCLVVKHYSAFGISHGDIQPSTVHLDFYKFPQVLENPVLFPSGSSNLAKAVFDQSYVGALSPLQAQQLLAGIHNNSIHETDDLWGVAMTTLCYASLRPLEYFYSRQGSSLLVTGINDVLSEGILGSGESARKEIFSLPSGSARKESQARYLL